MTVSMEALFQEHLNSGVYVIFLRTIRSDVTMRTILLHIGQTMKTNPYLPRIHHGCNMAPVDMRQKCVVIANIFREVPVLAASFECQC